MEAMVAEREAVEPVRKDRPRKGPSDKPIAARYEHASAGEHAARTSEMHAAARHAAHVHPAHVHPAHVHSTMHAAETTKAAAECRGRRREDKCRSKRCYGKTTHCFIVHG